MHDRVIGLPGVYSALSPMLQVECELIEKLDVLVNSNKGDDEYRELFNTM